MTLRLTLQRKVDQGVQIVDGADTVRVMVEHIGSRLITVRVHGSNPRTLAILAQAADAVPVTAGMGLRLTDIRGKQASLTFIGPEEINVKRLELLDRRQVLACPGCGHRVPLSARDEGKFDYDCSGCQEYTISQYWEVTE